MNDIIVFLPQEYNIPSIYRWWRGNWGGELYSGVMRVQGLVVEPLPTPKNWYLIPAG